MLTLDQTLYRESAYALDRFYYAHKQSSTIMKRPALSALSFSIKMILRGPA